MGRGGLWSWPPSTGEVDVSGSMAREGEGQLRTAELAGDYASKKSIMRAALGRKSAVGRELYRVSGSRAERALFGPGRVR